MKALFTFRGAAPLLLVALLVFVSNTSAQACSACYGDTTGSKMGNAAAVGIFAMVVIMFFMLGAIGMFMRHLAYRAKHPLPDYNELLGEDDKPAVPGPKP